MAKTSAVEKNNRRRKLVASQASKRAALKAVIMNQLDELETLQVPALLDKRYQRLRRYGAFTGG